MSERKVKNFWRSRAKAKQASRDADAAALASGEKTGEQLRKENEVFGEVARSARLDFAASKFERPTPADEPRR